MKFPRTRLLDQSKLTLIVYLPSQLSQNKVTWLIRLTKLVIIDTAMSIVAL